ncbi:MAG: CPBP family intramembrane metalloprotease [Micrococcus sp.]|nr:CPBP family intramembrane metalloprotease [Micrococcus sp.]
MIQDPRQAPQYPHSAPPPGQQPAPQDIPPGWPKRGQRYGHPAPQAAGIPPGWPGRAQRERIVMDPGSFTWMDLATVLAYVLIFMLGGAAVVALIPGFMDRFTDADGTVNAGSFTFAVNLISYAVLTALVLIACWRPFVRSFRTFRDRGWLKGGLIPVVWFACIMVNALVVFAAGEPIKSANQLAIEEMTTQVDFLPMVLVTVLMAPFVEEYVFRHLMIGKLSRYINVWVCVVLSMVLFAMIHFISTGFRFNPVELIPYLTLAAAICVAYVLTGKSLAYVVILHVFNNLVSIVVAYTLLPLVS